MTSYFDTVNLLIKTTQKMHITFLFKIKPVYHISKRFVGKPSTNAGQVVVYKPKPPTTNNHHAIIHSPITNQNKFDNKQPVLPSKNKNHEVVKTETQNENNIVSKIENNLSITSIKEKIVPWYHKYKSAAPIFENPSEQQEYVYLKTEILNGFTTNQQTLSLENLDRFNKLLSKAKNKPKDKELEEIMTYIDAYIKENNLKPDNYDFVILPATRDVIEHKRSLRNIFLDPLLKSFYSKEQVLTCYTTQDFIDEIERLKIGRRALKRLSGRLTEREILEIGRRLGLVVNNDATFPKSEFFPNLSGLITIKEGEGPKFTEKFYNTIKKHSISLQEDGIYPNVKAILNSVNNNELFVGIFNENREPPKNTLILSGHDLHMFLYLPHPDNTEMSIIPAMFTSAHTEDTILLSKKQQTFIDNSPTIFSNKDQMIRFVKILRQVYTKDIQELPKGTAYIREGIADNGLSIHNIVRTHIENNSNYFSKNFIEHIPEYTKDHVTDITKKFIKDAIKELKQQYAIHKKDLENLTESERKLKNEKYETKKIKQIDKQKENIFNSRLSLQDQTILKIFNRWNILIEKDNKNNKITDSNSDDAIKNTSSKTSSEPD